MMTAKRFGRVVWGGTGILAAAFAHADDSGFYSDFDLGRATYAVATAVHFPTDTLSVVDPHSNDTSWGLTVGYRFTPHFGSEVGYVNLEFDHYDGVGDATSTGDTNVNVATIGVGYLF